MTSYKAKPIPMREWREIMQLADVWDAFMDHPERLSVQDYTDFMFGAKFYPFGEEQDEVYYTLVGIFPKSQVTMVLERTPDGDWRIKKNRRKVK